METWGIAYHLARELWWKGVHPSATEADVPTLFSLNVLLTMPAVWLAAFAVLAPVAELMFRKVIRPCRRNLALALFLLTWLPWSLCQIWVGSPLEPIWSWLGKNGESWWMRQPFGEVLLHALKDLGVMAFMAMVIATAIFLIPTMTAVLTLKKPPRRPPPMRESAGQPP